jgi:hypothetical protein
MSEASLSNDSEQSKNAAAGITPSIGPPGTRCWCALPLMITPISCSAELYAKAGGSRSNVATIADANVTPSELVVVENDAVQNLEYASGTALMPCRVAETPANDQLCGKFSYVILLRLQRESRRCSSAS